MNSVARSLERIASSLQKLADDRVKEIIEDAYESVAEQTKEGEPDGKAKDGDPETE